MVEQPDQAASRRSRPLLEVRHDCHRHWRLVHTRLQGAVQKQSAAWGWGSRRSCSWSCCWHQQVQGPLTLVTLPTHISFSRPLLWRAITMHSAATSWVQQGAQRSTSAAPSGPAGPACRQQPVIINHTEHIGFRLDPAHLRLLQDHIGHAFWKGAAGQAGASRQQAVPNPTGSSLLAHRWLQHAAPFIACWHQPMEALHSMWAHSVSHLSRLAQPRRAA